MFTVWLPLGLLCGESMLRRGYAMSQKVVRVAITEGSFEVFARCRLRSFGDKRASHVTLFHSDVINENIASSRD